MNPKVLPKSPLCGSNLTSKGWSRVRFVTAMPLRKEINHKVIDRFLKLTRQFNPFQCHVHTVSSVWSEQLEDLLRVMEHPVYHLSLINGTISICTNYLAFTEPSTPCNTIRPEIEVRVQQRTALPSLPPFLGLNCPFPKTSLPAFVTPSHNSSHTTQLPDTNPTSPSWQSGRIWNPQDDKSLPSTATYLLTGWLKVLYGAFVTPSVNTATPVVSGAVGGASG